LQLLFPACPHVASELWQKNGNNDSIENSVWPIFDKKFLQSDIIKLAIQINGKTKQIIEVQAGVLQEEIEKQALGDIKIKELIGNNQPIKTIYVAGRIINFVVK